MCPKICLKLKDDKDGYICTEEWYLHNTKKKPNNLPTGPYQILIKGFITSMEHMIAYCLSNNIDIEIPKDYKVTKLYNILFTTADLTPGDRGYSSCRSCVLYTSTDEQFIQDNFEYLCKQINKKKINRMGKKYVCWDTEDYASNQIIHSYNIEVSYQVEKINTK